MRSRLTSQAHAGVDLPTLPGVSTGFSRGNSLGETFPAERFYASIAPGYNGGNLHMTLLFITGQKLSVILIFSAKHF